MYTTFKLKLTLFNQRTGKDVDPIDTTVCGEENGHDDDEGGFPLGTSYVGGLRVSLHDDRVPYFSNLPITHEMQDYCKCLLECKLETKTLNEIHCRVNEAEDMGWDEDLIDGTDPTLRL